MLYYCGLRRCELLNLDWDDINLESKLIFIRSTKNKNDRIIPIHLKVLELLEKYLEQRLPLTCKALIVGEIDKTESNYKQIIPGKWKDIFSSPKCIEYGI